MKLPYSGYLRRPAGSLLLYYITGRRQFPGSAEEQEQRLLQKIAECAAAGVDYIQLREKDLSIRALQALANAAIKLLPPGSRTRILINARTDVALACRAHGVHLPANDLPASEVRAIFNCAGMVHPLIAVSAHSLEELSYAQAHGADFAVFGPVFEKGGALESDGIEKLKEACDAPDRAIPILALGGVTLENAGQCIAAGANGIAAIRMFQENEVAEIVSRLRKSDR